MKNKLYVKSTHLGFFWLYVILFSLLPTCLYSQSRITENFNRGGIAVKTNDGVFLGWRILATDSKEIAFNLYRNGVLMNPEPLTGASNYTDNEGQLTDVYVLQTIGNHTEEDNEVISVWETPYLKVPVNCPPSGTSPSGSLNGATYTYNDPSLANSECMIADIDGDGEYEIIIKWEPSNWRDNSQTGYTGNTYFDAYKLDGTQLWRIDLGHNVRAGAHYSPFLVADFEGNGLPKLICKTAPGTIDGNGKFVLLDDDDPYADYRIHSTSSSGSNRQGFVLSGPEYLTLFNGQTGEEMHTIPYNPPRGKVSDWGDNYGNRVDRFLACVAYLDGVKPSAVMCRGYYTRSTLAAYDVVDGKLVERWFHDSPTNGQGAYGEGYHNLSVADVDGDGFDEIIYGSCCIDHDGSVLYATRFGHGDAIHVSKIDPDREGLQVWSCHEEKKSPYGYELRDAKTGEVIFGEFTGADIGRAMAADIDPNYPGLELWTNDKVNGTKLFDCKGNVIANKRPGSVNFRIYWTDDLQDELLDKTQITKWNGNGTNTVVDFSQYGAASNNNTKPCLTADIFGDWREEAVFLNKNCELMIFTTTMETEHRLYTPMHDPVYRMGIAWQNVAYNQPPHLSFYIGDGTEEAPIPEITPIKVEPSIMLNKTEETLFIDETQTIRALPLGDLQGEIKWATGDNEIATITAAKDNKFRAIIEGKKKGTTTITASISTYDVSMKLIVGDVVGVSEVTETGIWLIQKKGEKIIRLESESPILQADIYSLRGSLLSKESNIQALEYEIPYPNDEKIVILQVKTTTTVETFKVIL